jgi:hypothetical protein
MMGMPTPDGFDIFNFVRDYLSKKLKTVTPKN